MSRGHFADAESSFREALERADETGHTASPELAIDYSNLAHALDALGRVEEAEDYFRRAFAIDLAVRGPIHPGRLLVMGNLGLLLVRSGRPSEAVELFEEAIQIGRATNTDNAISMLRHMAPRAGVLEDYAREAQALEAWHECFDLHRKASGHDDLRLLISGSEIIELSARMGRSDQSKALVRRLSPLIESAMDSRRSIDLAVSGLQALAVHHVDQRDWQKARDTLERLELQLRRGPRPAHMGGQIHKPGLLPGARLALDTGRCEHALDLLAVEGASLGSGVIAGSGSWSRWLEARALEQCGRWPEAVALYEAWIAEVRERPIAQSHLVPRLELLRLAAMLRVSGGSASAATREDFVAAFEVVPLESLHPLRRAELEGLYETYAPDPRVGSKRHRRAGRADHGP